MNFLFVITGLLVTVFADQDKEAARKALQNPDLYDGDMIVTAAGLHDMERNGIVGDYFRWPNAVIPYVIDNSLTQYTHLIEEGMKNYHDNTCVRFVKRTNEKDYVKIFADADKCFSAVGRVGGQQRLSLGVSCRYVGTVVHELGHTVGFYHEMKRSDRDDYLIINYENIKSDMLFNFSKFAPNKIILYNSFDYDSIMIYGNNAFSKNNLPTMIARNGQKLIDPYDKQGMTKSNIERVNKMYNCVV